MDDPTRNERLWPVALAPGVRKRHQIGFYFVSFATIALFVAVNSLAPHLFRYHLKDVSEGGMGSAAGDLMFWAELVMIASIGTYGVLSEKVGRRPIYCIGFVLIGISYLLSPLAATLGSLLLYRAVFALGAAAAAGMLTTVAADYVVNADRGKANAVMGLCNGLGALTAALVFTKLPSWLMASGMDGRSAGQVTYSILGGFALVSALLAWLLLDGRRPAASEQRLGFLALAREGLRAAREPGVALSYGAALVSRGDNAVIGGFLVLWVVQFSDYSPDAQARGGQLMAILQGASLLSAPLLGVMADRLNRVFVLQFGLLLATVGYLGTYFIQDPLSLQGKLVMALVGVGHIAALLASQVLVQQQAPVRIRGAVIGVFGIFGAVGILIASKIGGALFDSTLASGERFFAGPFVFLGVLNGIVLLWALIVGKRVRAPEEPSVATGRVPSVTRATTSIPIPAPTSSNRRDSSRPSRPCLTLA